MKDAAADDISIASFISLLREHSRAACVGMAAAFLATLIYLHVAEYTYTISLQLASVETANQSGSSLGGLADAVGLGSSLNAPHWNLYATALQSPLAAEEIVRRPQLMHLMFYRQWTGEGWRVSSGPLHELKNLIYFILGIPATQPKPPGLNEVQEFLDKKLDVEQQRRTATINLTLQWHDPDAGKAIVQGIGGIVDDLLRIRDLARADNYASYAADELQKSTTIEYRQALSQLLVQQERRKMIASAHLPFAAQDLGPPLASNKPTSPPAIALLILSFPAGTFLGIMVALLWHKFKASRVSRRVMKASVA